MQRTYPTASHIIILPNSVLLAMPLQLSYGHEIAIILFKKHSRKHHGKCCQKVHPIICLKNWSIQFLIHFEHHITTTAVNWCFPRDQKLILGFLGLFQLWYNIFWCLICRVCMSSCTGQAREPQKYSNPIFPMLYHVLCMKKNHVVKKKKI